MGRKELFEEVAEFKLRKAEKDLLKVFKRYVNKFQDAFWDLEFEALYGDEATSAGDSTPLPIASFDQANKHSSIALSADGLRAESNSTEWAGVQLNLFLGNGDV